MPRGYRCVILAAFGWLILGAAPSENRNPDGKQIETGHEISNTLGDIASSLKEANRPKRETADCPKGGDDRKSDLCAQWKAADAAQSSAEATWVNIYLAVVGLLLGAITMAAAIAAAWFARSAAQHTEAANKIAERHARMQSRPYFSPVGINWSIRVLHGISYCDIKIVWKNHGGTPTRNLVFSPLALWDDGALQLEAINTIFEPDSVKSIVGPGQEIWGQSTRLTLDEVHSVYSGERTFYIYGHARYQDVFGNEEHITNHLWQIGIIRYADRPLEGDNIMEVNWTVVGKVNDAT